MKISTISAPGIKASGTSHNYIDSIDHCPVCNLKCQPLQIGARVEEPVKTGSHLWIYYQCPSIDCQNVFVAKFRREFSTKNYGSVTHDCFERILISPTTFQAETFPETIASVSAEFPIIYNQALRAEKLGLTHICGPGFRKALEYLVKDFCVSEHKQDEEIIKSLPLAKCIKKYISDTRAQKVTERAAWIGNDETHYERKWVARDIEDLKLLVRMVVNFIDNEKMAQFYLSEMPETKKAD